MAEVVDLWPSRQDCEEKTKKLLRGCRCQNCEIEREKRGYCDCASCRRATEFREILMSLPEAGCKCALCSSTRTQYTTTLDHRREMDDDTKRLLERAKNACAFYMELHNDEKKRAWRGYSEKECIEGILGNFADFMIARGKKDERETLAEGIGVINHMLFFLDLYCTEELDKVQDWRALLDEVEKE